jgi:TonB family protein
MANMVEYKLVPQLKFGSKFICGLLLPLSLVTLVGCTSEAGSSEDATRSKAHRVKKIRPGEIDYGIYISTLQKQLCRQWRQLKYQNQANSNRSGVVGFTVGKDGRLSNVKVLKSSRSQAFDNIMLSTLSLKPLPPPPAGGAEQVTLQFTFDERMFNDPLVDRSADSQACLESLNKEIKANPDKTELYWQRGNLFLLSGDSRAISDLSRVVATRTYGADAYLARARAFEDAADWKRCLTDCLTALALKPESVETRILLADTYQRRNELAKAFTTINEAIDLAPESADAYVSRAYLALLARDYKSAIADCNTAIALDPRCVAAWAYRGDAQSELDNLNAALKDYSKAVDNDPDQPSLLLRRAELFNDMGQFSKAVVDSTAAIKLDSENGEAYFCRSFANRELGFNAQAKLDQLKARHLGFKG